MSNSHKMSNKSPIQNLDSSNLPRLNINNKLSRMFRKRLRESTSQSNSNNGITLKRQKTSTRNPTIKSFTNSRSKKSNNLTGGKILGEGGINIIMSDPRLPIVGEIQLLNRDDVISIKNKKKYAEWLKMAQTQISKIPIAFDTPSNIIEKPFQLLKDKIKDDKQKLNNAGRYLTLPIGFDRFVLEDRSILYDIDKAFFKTEEGKQIYDDPYFYNSKTQINKRQNLGRQQTVYKKALGDLENYRLDITDTETLLYYFMALQESILPAVNLLHDNDLAHFDIKLANVLVYKSDKGLVQFKLSDFDLLTDINERVKNPKTYFRDYALSNYYYYYPPIMNAFTYSKFHNRDDTTVDTEGINPLKFDAFIKKMLEDRERMIHANDMRVSKESILVYYDIAQKLKKLCEYDKLSSEDSFKLIKELAEIKYGFFDDDTIFNTGDLDIEQYFMQISSQTKTVWRKFTDFTSASATVTHEGKESFSNGTNKLSQKLGGKLRKDDFYKFIAKITDIYSFCMILLDLLHRFINELTTIKMKLVKNDILVINQILAFIKKYQSIDTYINIDDENPNPTTIFRLAYQKFIGDLTKQITRNMAHNGVGVTRF